MRGLARELNKLNSSLPPRLYLSSLLQEVTDYLGFRGGVILKLAGGQKTQVVADNIGDELKASLIAFLPALKETACLQQTVVLSESKLPSEFIAQGIISMYWLPVISANKLAGACVWLSDNLPPSIPLEELEYIAALVAVSLGGYSRIHKLNVNAVSLKNEIREGKRAEELNFQLAEDINLLLNTSGEGLYGIDLEGKCTFVNKAASRMLGYSPEELLGYRMHELIHHTRPDGSKYPAEECDIHTYQQGTGSREQDELLWRKDGTCFPAACSAYPIIREGQLLGAVVTFADVTYYKQIEKRLKDSEELSQAIVNELPAYIAMIDAHGIIRTANTPWKNITALHPDIFRGVEEGENYVEFCRKPSELLAEAMPKFADAIGSIIRGELEEYYLEFPCQLQDHVQWFAGRASRMAGTGPVRLMVCYLDITSLKEAEQKNKRLAENNHLILDSSGEGIFGVNPQGKIVFVNQAACSLLGYKTEDLQNQLLTNVIYHCQNESLSQEKCPVEETLRTGELIWVDRDLFWRKNGSPLPVQYSAAPMHEEGKIRGAVVVFSDLSKILEAEHARRDADNFARSVVNGLSARIAIMDRDGQIIGTNPAWQRFSLATASQPFSAEFAQGFSAVASREQKEFHMEYPCNVSGETRWFQGTVRSLSEERLIVVHEDITERIRAVETLKLAKAAAEEASRAKSEFLANMSHEIRTPMNAIIGMAELLEDTALDSQQKQYVSIFRTAGDHLLSLIDNILDLSKIESGRLELESAEYNIGELVEDTATFFAVSAHRKNLELTCQVEKSVPHTVKGDPGRVRQILVNLVGNAIKFTQKGEIDIQLQVKQDSQELLFTVSDTGIGIPQDKIDRIFSAFTQYDSSTTRRYGGSGLGLKISKRLVEMMGGKIWVESRPKAGSTFSFTVPFQVGSQGKAASRQHLSHLKTLVIDDNATNLLILKEYLSPLGADVHLAADGNKGLELFEQAFASGQGFDLILLDCRMPDMDGFDVTRRIREDYKSKDVVIMMLTSDNSSSDIQICQELNINAYLVKPVRRRELMDTILSVLAGEVVFREVPFPVDSTPATDTKARILLVDDSQDNILLVQTYLSKGGFYVDTAENGEIAVAKYKAKEYDLVLMDMEMPIMDGYTATGLIREWEKQKGRRPAPVIALTAYAFEEDLQKSLAAGCTDHVTKPVRKQKLLKVLAQYLKGEA